LIPPSIMAVVYGATGNVSIGRLFLGGVVPGVLVGLGLMIYSYFFGPAGFMKKRASFFEFAGAAWRAAVPLVIPVIIMGGILTGWFTPTEAGLVAVVYILVVAIPVLNWRHLRELPLDIVKAGLLYSIPLITVAGLGLWMDAGLLRGPDLVSDWITTRAGTDPVTIMFLLVGAFVIIRRFRGRDPGHHHLHADYQQAYGDP
jgi:C4-dicarboxylate transporter, DctM subunit